MALHPMITFYPEMIVVQEGNEAVRQAIQNKASYRVYILFILLVFSFRLVIMVKGNLKSISISVSCFWTGTTISH